MTQPEPSGLSDPAAPAKTIVTDASGNVYLVPSSVLAAARVKGPPAAPGMRASRTTFDVGGHLLARLSAALGHDDARTTTFSSLFAQLGELCAAQDAANPPRWSGIGDDCSPFEFSVDVRRGGTELRVLVEAQDDPASPDTYWNAGMRLNQWLVDRYAGHLDSFRTVQDLFDPRHRELFGVVGHGAAVGKDGQPVFKIYVNPLAHGLDRDVSTVSEALARLGCGEVFATLLPLRRAGDWFSHFSLDLVAGTLARVKVYIKHFNLTLPELDRLEASVSETPSEWAGFSQTILGAQQGPLSKRPIYTAYTMAMSRPDVVEAGTVQLPILPYVASDIEANKRILTVLERNELPDGGYRKAVEALRRAPLEREQGLHSHVSYSRQGGQPRVAVYFGSRLFVDRYGWLALDPIRSWPENCWPSPARRRVAEDG